MCRNCKPEPRDLDDVGACGGPGSRNDEVPPLVRLEALVGHIEPQREEFIPPVTSERRPAVNPPSAGLQIPWLLTAPALAGPVCSTNPEKSG
jgi:hypothetical protein